MIAPLQLFDPDAPTSPVRTLDDVYHELKPQLPLSLSRRTLVEHRTALKHWREATGDPDLAQVTRKTITRLRDYLVGLGLSAATINKTWRTLRALFRFACEELRWIEEIPAVSYKMQSRLIFEAAPQHREVLTHAEIEQLWQNCLLARYPLVEPCLTWRTFLVLMWSYGMRTDDLVQLPRSAILWTQKLVRFAADKTSKLQGLPLTPLVEWHLQRYLAAVPSDSPRLFPGLKKRGHVNRRTGKQYAGYYTAWNEVISHGVEPRVLLKHLRQAMVSELNDVGLGDDIGGWAAGHSAKGVTAKNYDNPSQRVRRAFLARPVPPCFLWGMRDERTEASTGT